MKEARLTPLIRAVTSCTRIASNQRVDVGVSYSTVNKIIKCEMKSMISRLAPFLAVQALGNILILL